MMRIDKLLSNLKFGSRKDIEKIIKQKRVMINHKLCLTPKQQVDPKKDEIWKH